MRKILTLRISNASPAWPHEYVVHKVSNDGETIQQITYPMDNLQRMIERAVKEYEDSSNTTVELERITCQVTSYINT